MSNLPSPESSLDSYGARHSLDAPGGQVAIRDLRSVAAATGSDLSRLPFSIKVVLENLLRHEDGQSVTADDIAAIANWDAQATPGREISFRPARVLLQDFTGVPAVVDLAAMRDAMADLGGDPASINPLMPCELVIDHSVQVDSFGTPRSLFINSEREFERNHERYAFLRWGQTAFDNFKVVAARDGDRAPGEPRVPGARRVRRDDRGRAGGLSGHGGGHGQPHDDDQRPRRARLGRGRHRGRGRDAGPAALHAGAAGARVPAARRAPRGGDGDRSRASGHGSPARDGGRREVRRVLRARSGGALARRPRHAGQHVARVRLHLRHLPDRCRDARLPPLHRPRGGARRARRGVRPGAGSLPRRGHPAGGVQRPRGA